MLHFKNTEYGFEYGDAKVTRLFSDENMGWVTIGVASSKYTRENNLELQIYITKTGKIRIHDKRGEWKQPSA